MRGIPRSQEKGIERREVPAARRQLTFFSGPLSELGADELRAVVGGAEKIAIAIRTCPGPIVVTK
jgi:hypothetical protein